MTATHDALKTSLTRAELINIRRHMLPDCVKRLRVTAGFIGQCTCACHGHSGKCGDNSTDNEWREFQKAQNELTDWLDGK